MVSESETVVQERLALLEAGESLAVCLAGLSAEQAALLQTAAAVRNVPFPARTGTAVAAQRSAILLTAQQTLAARATPTFAVATVPWLERLRAILHGLRLHKEPALGLAFVLILMLAFAWFGWQGGRSESELTASLPNGKGEITLPADTPLTETATEAVASAVAPTHTAEASVALAATQPAYQAFFPILSTTLLSGPTEATLHNLRGFVEIQLAGGAWTAVTANTHLPANSRIRTGAYSGADLAFYDGSQASLGPNAELSLDQVNTLPAQDGFRTVVMTQWAGESEHQVQFRNDGGSHYEVKTVTGSGLARGTMFRVNVAALGRAQYTVREGKVDVSNNGRTVAVIAGQTTSFNQDEPPVPPTFIVTGTGVVTQIGPTWIIAGQPFTVNEQTTIIDEPEVGDMVYVEGHLVQGGDPVADLIRRLDDDDENEFTLTGPVEAIGDAAWVVAGQTISVTADTQIGPDITIGDNARVRGLILLPGGHLLAEEITLLETDEGLPFEFVGIVQAITSNEWTISGITIAVNDETEIEAGIDLGDTVKVEGLILDDDTWLAEEIKLLEDDDATFTFTGEVMNMDPWLVAGIAFEVAEWAQIEPGIEVGDLVRVSGIILEDGTWLATQIELLRDDILQIVFVGVVESLNPWVISGLPITTDENTVIIGDISEGDLVRVTAWIRSDGTWVATQIQWLSSPVGQGCVAITAVITALNGNEIIISNGQTIILDEGIVVEGELQVGSVVLIVACVAEDGTIDIISIIIIYTPPPVPPPPPPAPTPGPNPPPAPGGNVTICHKPGTPAEKTKTVPESALGGHLGHGDTLGACP